MSASWPARSPTRGGNQGRLRIEAPGSGTRAGRFEIRALQPRLIAIDAIPYYVYKHEIRNDTKQRDERRDCAAAAPARRRRLFQPGQSGDPAGRRRGSQGDARRGEAPGLTRRAIEAALAGDMLAMKLCLERVLPRCHERPVTFSLPSLAAIGSGEIDEPSPQNVSRAMNAVTTAHACGEITPGEAATIAGGLRDLCANGRHCRGGRSPRATCCGS